MAEPFSLLRRAWLPVALDDGRREFVRPYDLVIMDGRTVQRIATGRPDCDVSLTEFLIGLLAVACPPASVRDWLKRFDAPPAAEALLAALTPFENALVLDGEGPRFFQDREKLEGEANSVAALFIDAPAEHFVKPGRVNVLSRAGAAIALATLQTSAPAGGRGHRTSLRGGGPLTTLVYPGTENGGEPTLWRKLWANTPEAGVMGDPQRADARRIFPWLDKTRVSDVTGVTTTPEDVHPAQAFFGMPRRIRLNFTPNTARRPCDLTGLVDEIVVESYVSRPSGFNYVAWGRRHPLSPYYQSQGGAEYLPVHLRSSHVGYSQWLGLAIDVDQSRVRARCLDAFERRAVNFSGPMKFVRQRARLFVAGYALDNMKPLDFAEALLPLISTGDLERDKSLNEIAREWIEAAVAIAGQIVASIKRALYSKKAKAARDSSGLEAAQTRFWIQTEDDFYVRLRSTAENLEALGADWAAQLHTVKQAGGAGWLASLRREALSVFDETAPIESAEAGKIVEVIAGRKMLGLMLWGYGKGGDALYAKLSQPKP